LQLELGTVVMTTCRARRRKTRRRRRMVAMGTILEHALPLDDH
jgi:hypothetical protein